MLEPGAHLTQTNFSFPPLYKEASYWRTTHFQESVCRATFHKVHMPRKSAQNKAASQRTLRTLPMGQGWECPAVLLRPMPATWWCMHALLLGGSLGVARSQGTRRSASIGKGSRFSDGGHRSHAIVSESPSCWHLALSLVSSAAILVVDSISFGVYLLFSNV